jgi:hypothetical protein
MSVEPRPPHPKIATNEPVLVAHKVARGRAFIHCCTCTEFHACPLFAAVALENPRVGNIMLRLALALSRCLATFCPNLAKGRGIVHEQERNSTRVDANFSLPMDEQLHHGLHQYP